MRLKSYLNEGINDVGVFKAVFMAGHPGAGKTYTLSKIKSGSIEPRVVNTDKLFFIFKDWFDEGWSEISPAVKDISLNQLALYINSVLPLAIDGTAGKPEAILRRRGLIESFGYDTGMIFINTSLETALERAEKRGKGHGRRVDPDFIKQSYDYIQKIKNWYRSKFDDWLEINNDEGQLNNKVITNAFKHMSNFYMSPIDNPVGRMHKENMIENGWKYLSPNIYELKEIKNILSSWYKR